MVTADDCSLLCWPDGTDPGAVPAGYHERCEKNLTDFSDPARTWAYCGCSCHHVPGLPGFDPACAGRYVRRGDL